MKTFLDMVNEVFGFRPNKKCKECGFPIDPTNEVYPAGSECICDLKEVVE